MRRGPFYRPATLSSLSDDDQPGLAALGVGTVYDLRTRGERESAPDQLPGGVQLRGLEVLANSATNIAAKVGDLAANPATLAESLAGDAGPAVRAVVPRRRPVAVDAGRVPRVRR